MFKIGSTIKWNNRLWKIIGFRMGKALLAEVNGTLHTTIDLKILETLEPLA